jgi:lysozyme
MAAGAIKKGEKGKAVKAFQEDLNRRAEPRFHPPLAPDGTLGPVSFRAFQDLGWAMGLTDRELDVEEIPATTLALFEDPDQRTAAQIKRARERASKLARHTIGFDGAPVFWGLAKPLLQARRDGWGGRLNAADRREGIPEQFGKKSQAMLFRCFQARLANGGRCPAECGGDCNAANPPGHSSHELRSDGTAFGKRPSGAKLNWWELGLDVEDTTGLLQHLDALGYKAHQTYKGSAQEVQHINFTADPGPLLAPEGPSARPARKPTLKVLAEPTGGRLKGIDVAEHQKTIDWKKVVASGRTFAWARATEGLGDPDTTFARNWAEMKKAGIARGAYHFARPCKGRDPREEVREFLGAVERAGGFADGDLVPMLDIEDFGPSGQLSQAATLDWARKFIHALHHEVGRLPVIYTGSFWREASMGNPADNLDCELWLAAYVDKPDEFVPKAWSDDGWLIWQRSATGEVPGISHAVDLDVMKGGTATLERLRM